MKQLYKNMLRGLLAVCMAGVAEMASAQVFLPIAGSNQIDCGLNTTICDHAGCSNDYSANADGYTIVQTVGTASVTVAGSYTLGAGDQIIVYNGAGIGGTVLNTLTGTGTYSIAGTPGQQITIRFISDGATQASGFSFTTTYSGACTAPGVNFGTAGSQTFPCATNIVLYDNGGGAANYTDNVNSTVVLTNAGAGIYTLSGTYTLANNDFIRIYNGVGTGGTLLASYTNGTGIAVNYSTQPGQTITVQFQTNASTVAAGFQLNVSHYGGCSCPTAVLTATATPSTICSGQNSQLNAAGLSLVENYSVSYPPYAPLACSGAPNGVGPVGDDVTSAAVTLPFPFTYFGTSYTQIGVTSNANIQFGPGPYSVTYTPTGTGIPTTSIDRMVALNFADWWADSGDITWHTVGTAPNRAFVICFNTLHPYPNGTPGNLTGQIVLYETSNIIDLVLTDSWMDAAASTDHLQTQGLQDIQNVGVPVPGRNATNWTATNSTVRFTPRLNYTYQWSPATFLNSTTITNPLASGVTSSTTYTVTATLGTAGACQQTASTTVTVVPVPTATITGGATTICSGQSTNMTASGGSNYLWSNGATTAAITVSPTTTTTYTVTVTNGGSCSATASRTITVNTTPVPNVTASPSTICAGQSSTISAFGGGTYLWNTGATTSSITVSPAANTTYSVTVTNAGCTATGSATVTVSASGAPVITCPPNINLTSCNPIATFTAPTATDPCGGGACASAPLATVLSNFNTNGAAITGAIPNPYNFTLDNGVTATSIGDGGGDMYDGGNFLNTNIAGSIAYTNGVVTPSAAFGAGGQYFTQKVNNMFIMVADMNNVSSFSITGNNGADGSGTANGFTYNVTVGCLSYNVFVKRVNGAGDPSINQIFIVPSGSAASHTFNTNTDNTEHILSGLNAATRLYYLLVGGNAGYAYTNAEIQTIVQNFLTQVGAAGSVAPPVTVTQIAGLPSGSAFPVGTNVVTFRATTSGGLTSTCSFNVIVADMGGPVMTCPSNINLGSCAPVATFATPTATDPCGPACSTSTLATIATNFASNGAAITGAIPNPFNFTLDNGPTATSISDGGNDMYDGGNVLNTNLATAIAYTNGVVTSSPAFGTGGQYVTMHTGNMFAMAANINGISSFSITGNNGADGSGTADGFTASVTVGCTSYDIFVKRVHSAFDPSINQIFIVPSGSGASHTFDTYTDNTQHTLNGLNTATRLYYLLVGGSNGYAYTNAEITAMVTNFLTQVSATVANPVTVTQIAGLPSGSSFPVGTTTVTFRATNQAGSTSTCSFNVVVTAPSASITPSVTNLCSGGNATLTAAGGGSYAWNTGATTAAITVSPAATTTYSVTVTDAFMCTATANQPITVNTLSTTPTIAPIAGTFCPNTDVTLTASGGTAGTGSTIYWYTGANGTGTALGTGNSITFTATSTTTIYARRQGTCNTTTDDAETVNVKTYIYATNATSTSTYCTDNAGWHHFYVGDNIIFSVRGDISGAPAGFPVATIWENSGYYQNPGVAPTVCALALNPGEEQFEMERSWNLNLGGAAPVGTYDVRFYYQPAERTAIETAANNWMATYSACGYTYKYPTPNGFYWFKNTGGTYSAPDYDGTHYAGTIASTVNGINYTEMSGIPGFSGGSGAVILVPNTLLSVEWLNFNGETVGKENHLHWATVTEKQMAYYEVQRSYNGVEFETIGTVAAAGTTQAEQHYNFVDQQPIPGLNYYRIRGVDNNGEESWTNVIVLELKSDDNYVFYPNPTQDVVYYQFTSTKNDELRIEVLDVLGRTLQTQKMGTTAGVHRVAVDLSQYPAAAYTLRVTYLNQNATHTAKIIKNRP